MVHTTKSRRLSLPHGIDGTLDELREESMERWGVPEHLAERAAAATRRQIDWDDSRQECSRARTQAYYWGSLRGMALRSRSRETAPLRARFALATIVDDLRSRGVAPAEVRDIVVASHGDLLQECGMREEYFEVAC